VHEDSEVLGRESNRGQKGTEAGLLPIEVHADIHWHPHGGGKYLEKSRHRKDRGQPLPQGSENRQYDPKQGHPTYDDQHQASVRSRKLPLKGRMGIV
jgi:hypothetical protein